MQVSLDFSPAQSLRSLVWLRGFAILSQMLAIAVVHYGLGMPLPLPPLAGIVLALAAWNSLAWLRLRQPWAVTQLEVSLHLAVDTLALTGLFALSGGPGNPFVSFYLVLIAVAAAILQRGYAWALTLLCMGLYSLLVWNYSRHLHDPALHGGFHLHVLGMWANFLVSAALMAAFVTTMATAVRRREQMLAEAREERLRNEHIVAMGALAAGAAHELSTPLSTMAVLAGELRRQMPAGPAAADLRLLQEQIALCKQQLGLLLASAGQARGEAGGATSTRRLVEQVLDRWRLMRPETPLRASLAEPFEDLPIVADHTLSQALLCVLDNAADAAAGSGRPEVELQASCRDGRLACEILDRGPGLSAEQQAQAGRGVFTTKPDGFGLGLVLSHASLGRLGGELRLEPRSGGGTRSCISLPLHSLLLPQGA